MFAVKANRQYRITETEKQKFIDRGYKIARLENGKLVFEEPEGTGEVAELIKERTVLKGQLTKANNKIAELEKEIDGLKGEGE